MTFTILILVCVDKTWSFGPSPCQTKVSDTKFLIRLALAGCVFLSENHPFLSGYRTDYRRVPLSSVH